MWHRQVPSLAHVGLTVCVCVCVCVSVFGQKVPTAGSHWLTRDSRDSAPCQHGHGDGGLSVLSVESTSACLRNCFHSLQISPSSPVLLTQTARPLSPYTDTTSFPQHGKLYLALSWDECTAQVSKPACSFYPATATSHRDTSKWSKCILSNANICSTAHVGGHRQRHS